MKVKYSKPKNQRILKCMKFKHDSFSIKSIRPFWIEPIEGDWWFCYEQGQWEQGYNGRGVMTTSYYSMSYNGFKDAYSLKAVKRLIHKWNVPKGTVFRASLPFVGHDIFITK